MAESTSPLTPSNNTTKQDIFNHSLSDGLGDIKYLLHLEILKRFKDDEASIGRQLEEKMRNFKEALADYCLMYSKFISLVELSATRSVLDKHNLCTDDKLLQSGKMGISNITQKISSKNVTGVLDCEVLAKFKDLLKEEKNHPNLAKLETDLTAQRAMVKEIQSGMENIESSLVTATTQGMDFFVDQFRIDKNDGNSKE